MLHIPTHLAEEGLGGEALEAEVRLERKHVFRTAVTSGLSNSSFLAQGQRPGAWVLRRKCAVRVPGHSLRHSKHRVATQEAEGNVFL